MSKIFSYYVRAMARDVENELMKLDTKTKMYVPTYQEYKSAFERSWKHKNYTWVNVEGNFPIGNKSGFDGIFPKIMTCLIGTKFPFRFFGIQEQFQEDAAMYYDEHLNINVDLTVKAHLDNYVESAARNNFINDEDDEEFIKYLDSLEVPEQIDVDNFKISPLRALFLSETIMSTDKIEPGRFVDIRNYIYKKAYEMMENKIKTKSD